MVAFLTEDFSGNSCGCPETLVWLPTAFIGDSAIPPVTSPRGAPHGRPPCRPPPVKGPLCEPVHNYFQDVYLQDMSSRKIDFEIPLPDLSSQ